MKLVCNNCGYRFETEISKKRCPYCGKDGAEKEKDASELLEEIEG